MRAISSWSVASVLTLVLSTTAVALMSHGPGPGPLSEPIAAHSAPATTVPSTEVATSETPTSEPTTIAPPTTLTPVPTTVTYTYGGDDSSSGNAVAPSGAYGDD